MCFCGDENRVWDPRPKLLGFLMSGLATFPICRIKRHGEGRESKFITQLRTCVGRGRISTQSIFSHLWGADMSLSRQRTGDREQRYDS
jgi:hypothetical protein